MKRVDKYNKKKQPKRPKINEENIPDELKKIPAWVCWLWKWDKKKWTKPPCNPDGYNISHLKSSLSYEDCIEGYKNNSDIAGIGFSLRKDDPYCGIDFDDCLNKKGEPNKRLKKAIKLLDGAYIERSPSGAGVRVFGTGIPKTRGSSKTSREIEIYNSGRYLTITGQQFGESNGTLTNIEKACKKIDKKIYKRKESKNKSSSDGFGLEQHDKLNPKLDKIRKALFKMRPENRDTWIKCGMAIHYETNASAAGFELWAGWSRTTTADNDSEETCYDSWNSFKKISKKDNPLTLKTILYYIKEEREFDKNDFPVISSCDSIAKANIKDVQNIMEPWFMKGSVNMVHAKRGLGKTHFCLGISLALAAGGRFLKWKVEKPRKVLYADGEMPLSLLKDFLNDQIKATGMQPKNGNLSFITIDKQKDGHFPSLSTEEGREWFEMAINQLKPEVIVFDSLFTCFKINEYAGDYWSEIQEWLIRLRSTGIDILLVHHDNKSGNAQSGRVDKEHILNSIIHLKEPKGLAEGKSARFEVSFNKARHFWGDDAKSFEARLGPLKKEYSEWKVLNSNSTTKEAVGDMFKQGLTAIDICDVLNLSKGMVSKYKKDLLNDGSLKETDIKSMRRNTGATRKRKKKGSE